MNSLEINAFEFCRRNERREGQFAVSELPRFAAECADSSGTLGWTVQGFVGQLGHEQMRLSVSGTVMLRCQRCMEPFAYQLESDSVLLLAKSEESADEIEASLEDDSIDVIVGANASDLKVLIEDEALLALPLSPRHDVCPDPSLLDKLGQQGKVSPFSVLKGKTS